MKRLRHLCRQVCQAGARAWSPHACESPCTAALSRLSRGHAPHTTDSRASLFAQHPSHVIGSAESPSSCPTIGVAIVVMLIGERTRWRGAAAVAGGHTGDQPLCANHLRGAARARARGSREPS